VRSVDVVDPRTALDSKASLHVWHDTYMQRSESAIEVRHWFQASIAQIWPIAEGSLSLRKTRCIRKNCTACTSGEGHSSYVLSGRRGSKRFSIYIPDDLAPDIQQAIENGRQLRELINEAGVRLVNALKNQRKGKSGK
jgi:hypothetical protein